MMGRNTKASLLCRFHHRNAMDSKRVRWQSLTAGPKGLWLPATFTKAALLFQPRAATRTEMCATHGRSRRRSLRQPRTRAGFGGNQDKTDNAKYDTRANRHRTGIILHPNRPAQLRTEAVHIINAPERQDHAHDDKHQTTGSFSGHSSLQRCEIRNTFLYHVPRLDSIPIRHNCSTRGETPSCLARLGVLLPAETAGAAVMIGPFIRL